MSKEEFQLQPNECLDLEQDGDTGQVICNIQGEEETMQKAEAKLNDLEFVEPENPKH
jgi:hypothetical protein